eukprot:gene17635-22487_t
MARLASFRSATRADSALVVDRRGRALLSDQGTPGAEQAAPSPALQLAVAHALAGTHAVMTDPYLSGDGGHVVIDFVAPVMAPGAAIRSLVVMRMDAASVLARLLEQWPVPNHSFHARLIDTAGRTVLPMVPGAVSGAMPTPGAGAVDTHDGQGRAVLAVTRHVPGTPWHLVVQLPGGE